LSTRKYRLQVEGMTCAGCEKRVERALSSIGAKNVEANFRRGEAVFELPEPIGIEQAKEAVHKAHYKAGEAEAVHQQKGSAIRDEGGEDYDFIVIGSGGAAFSAAIKAAEYGAKVAMIERGTIGGTCVNIGCIPSKTLLRSAEIQYLAKNHSFLGLHTSAGPADWKKLVEQKDELVKRLRRQKYIDLIDEYGFELIRGEARFINEKTVEVNGDELTAKRFLIATGASPSIPDIPGLKEVDYLTSTSLLELKELPKRLAVIGSGYIGLELGQLFHRFGVEVTLMQRGQKILPGYEPEISEAAEKALTEQCIRFIAGATFERVEQNGDLKKIHVTVNGEKKIVEAEQLLVATGRKPNTDALNLQAANVQVGPRGEVLADGYLRTTNPRIYAAGDVTLGPQLVYVAAYQGGIAADNAIGGLARKVNLDVVPSVIFTDPAIAAVGLTEKQAKERGYEVRTSVLPLDAVPRALVNRETTGLFKLVADAKTGKLLGVHLVAENAGDVIYAAALAVKFGLTAEDLRESLAPYLTMAEGLKLAALTFDKDVNKLSCCAG